MNQGGVHEYDRHKPERKTPGKSSARRIRKFIWLLDAGIAWRNGKNRHSPDSPSFQPKLRRVGIFGKSEVPCAFWTDVERAGNSSPSAKQCCQSDSIAAWSALDLTLHFRIRTFATSVVAKSDRRLCRRRQSRSVHRRLRRRARSRGGRVQTRHAEGDGRPGYAPGDLLKLYIYGYLNRVRSSRRLEAECHRNIEVIWLLRTLKPDFKTIADFRSDNRAAFRAVFHQFTLLCRGTQSFRARAAGGGRHAHQGGQQQEPQLYEELAGEVHQGGGQASGRIRNAGQSPNTALTEVSSKEYETNLDSDDLDHGNAQADQIIADNLSICRLKAMLSNQLAL